MAASAPGNRTLQPGYDVTPAIGTRDRGGEEDEEEGEEELLCAERNCSSQASVVELDVESTDWVFQVRGPPSTHSDETQRTLTGPAISQGTHKTCTYAASKTNANVSAHSDETVASFAAVRLHRWLLVGDSGVPLRSSVCHFGRFRSSPTVCRGRLVFGCVPLNW